MSSIRIAIKREEPKKLVTEIIIPGHVTPSLNELIKFAFYKKTKLRKFYEKYIWTYTRNQHKGPVRIEIYRHSSGTLDDDNFRGGCKPLVDSLKNQNVIIDDRDEILQERHYEQVKIARNGAKMTVIKITDL